MLEKTAFNDPKATTCGVCADGTKNRYAQTCINYVDCSTSLKHRQIYRALITKDKEVHKISFLAYSFVNVLAESGGTITSIMGMIGPIAMLFSNLSFELGVMNMLFQAKRAIKTT